MWIVLIVLSVQNPGWSRPMPGFITHNSEYTVIYVKFRHILVDKFEVFICSIDGIYVIAVEKCDGEPFTRQDAETENEVPL
jgi:hypothetical protein